MKADFSDADISFSGCGFMCIYHTGVCAALKEYAPQMVINRIYGASAGAIAAAALLCNVCISEATSAILQVICEARAGYLQALSPTFDLLGLARDGMERILPENAHILCSNRLHISLTRYEDCKNFTVTNFSSKEDLIQAILCSCFIPVFCGATVPKFHGVAYIDGGFSDNQPRFDERTITISPFSGESDICPMDSDSASMFDCNFHNTSFRLTTYNLYRLCSCFAPPSQDICSRFCRQGFTDALRFLTRNAITPCVKCLTIQSNSLPLPIYGTHTTHNTHNKFRRRLDSECEYCFEKLETSQVDSEMTTALFPEHMQRTLSGTKPINGSLLHYVNSFRVVKWSTRLLTPFIIPVNYWIMVLGLMNSWLHSASKTEFFFERLQLAVDAILKEVENRNLLCTPKFSYRMALSNKIEKSIVKEVKNEAQFFENDSQYLAYVNDVDSVSRLIDYAENHNAILAYHYLDSSNNLQVCEIFDVNREIPRVNCHSTIVNSPTKQLLNETHSDVVLTKSLNKKYLKENFSGKNFITLKEEDEEMNETQIEEDYETSTDSEEIELAREVSKRNMKKRRIPIIHDGICDEVGFDMNWHNVPPDPDDSSTRCFTDNNSNLANESKTTKKRDACCSPVRHFNLNGLQLRSVQQHHHSGTRRHTTIGDSSNITNSSSARSVNALIQNKKISPSAFCSSRSLSSSSTSSQSNQQQQLNSNFTEQLLNNGTMSGGHRNSFANRKIVSIPASSDSDVSDESIVAAK